MGLGRKIPTPVNLNPVNRSYHAIGHSGYQSFKQMNIQSSPQITNNFKLAAKEDLIGSNKRLPEFRENFYPPNRRLDFDQTTERIQNPSSSLSANRSLTTSTAFSGTAGGAGTRSNNFLTTGAKVGKVNLLNYKIPLPDGGRDIKVEKMKSNDSVGKYSPTRLTPGPSLSSDNQRRNYSVDSNVPDKVLNRNEKYRADAEETCQKLEIRNKINTWLENCKKWFTNNLLRKIVQENIENIRNLEQMLTIHYNRRLSEYEFVQQFTCTNQREFFAESNLVTTSLNDLVGYLDNEHYFWPVSNYSKESLNDINNKFKKLLKDRKRLDRYLRPQGYNIEAVRNYVLKRLYEIHMNNGQFNYQNEQSSYKGPSKLPSDIKILSNLFFTHVNNNSFDSKVNNRLGVHFKQVNPENAEPHFIIVSEGQTWSTIPGRDNLFCAITLFFYYIKKNMRGGKFLDDPTGELAKDSNQILGF